MDLPTISEQLIEARRLCAETQRLLNELAQMAASAGTRWRRIKRQNEQRWNIALSGNRLMVKEKPRAGRRSLP